MKYLIFSLSLLLLSGCCTICQKGEGATKMSSADKEVLATIMPFEKKLEKAWVIYQQADYDETMGKSGSNLSEKRKAVLEIYNDSENYQKIQALYKKYKKSDQLSDEVSNLLSDWAKELKNSVVLDEDLKKEMITLNEFTDKMVEARKKYLSKVIGKKGKEEKLSFTKTRHILWKDKDRQYRQRVFLARAKMGDLLLKEGYAKLVKERNSFAKKLAKSRGKKNWRDYNYYRLKYEQYGLDLNKTFALFDKLKKKTDKYFYKFIKEQQKKNNWSKFQPWDFDYLAANIGGDNLLDQFFPDKVAEKNVLSAFLSMGFDLKKYKIDMDLYPRKGKGDNAACFTIKAPQYDAKKDKLEPSDIRVYANLGDGGLEEISTLFHELGHAIHHAETRQYYWLDRNLERPNGTDYSLMEVPSTFFERIPATEEYLLKYAVLADGKKPSAKLIKEKFKQYQKFAKTKYLFSWRQILARIVFEKRMYEDNGKDIAKVWSRTMHEYLGVERADKVNAWIERPHFVAYPVYYQAYLLANIASAQVFDYLQNKFGKLLGNKEIAKILNQGFFRYGASEEFPTLIKNVCGKPFSEKALVAMSID